MGCRPVEISEAQVIDALGTGDSYRYLGVEQLFDPKIMVVRRAVAGLLGRE